MASFTLRVIAALAFLVVILPALAFPSEYSSQYGVYQTVVRAVSGGFLLAGGFTLVVSLEKTLLRAGGNNAFKLFYISAAGISGLGATHGISSVYPVNMALAVLVFSGMAIVASILWLRFYYAAAG